MRAFVILFLGVVAASLVTGCQSTTKVRPSEDLAFVRLSDDLWQIWVCDTAGRHFRQVTRSPIDKRTPRWTADGSGILFRSGNGEAFLADPATGDERQLLTGMEPVSGIGPANSDDRILFTKFKQTLADASDIWTAAPDGTARRQITNDVGLQYDPAASPDGQRIAYISGQGFGNHELYIMDADDSSKRRLTDDQNLDLLPAWHPNGKQLAYVSDITGNYDIWIMDLEDSQTRNMTQHEALDSCPAWSPDGRWIAFTSTRSGASQIWIMSADGTDARQVTRGDKAMEPSWRRTNP